MKLSKYTKFIHTKRFHLIVNEELIDKHNRSINTQNKLHNYALKYLEKTFGYKHLNRLFPRNQISKFDLIKKIMKKFASDEFDLKRWDSKVLYLHSQGAQQSLLTLITNFSEYRKVLYKMYKTNNQEKINYLNNSHGNNPKQRSWYRKGSINYLRGNQSYKTISLPNNRQIKILSNHFIKIQGFGVVQVKENIKNLKFENITISKIKRKNDDSYELQLVISKQVKRLKDNKKAGFDWNMRDNKIFHSSDNQELYLDPKIVNKARLLEDRINILKSKRDKNNHLSINSKKTIKLNEKIKFFNIKRTNILNEYYKHLAHILIDDYDLIVLEQLDSKEMRFKKRTRPGINKKLALIKPYLVSELIKQLANKTGKTLIQVDSYKTSQVEFQTTHQEKHDINVRMWVSQYTKKLIDRDLNAAQNILDWGMNPKKHIKLKDYPNIKATSLIKTN